MEISGIYVISNLENDKSYVGQSLRVKERIRHHRYELKHNKHYNQHLQASWNKYGEKSFLFYVYCCALGSTKETIAKNLNILEKEVIIHKSAFEKGYNLTTGGDSHEVSIETKRKLSESHKGIKPSEYCRIKTSERMKGRIVSEETKYRLSVAIKKYYEEAKNNNIDWERPSWNKGMSGYKLKPCSDERKRKIGEAQKGEKNHNFGKITTEEIKNKIRASNQGSMCYLAKLNEYKVIDIKKRLLMGETGAKLAREYGVARTQISMIKNGKTWRHVNI